jgi:hypothetical protein
MKTDRRKTDGAEVRKSVNRTQLDTLLAAPNGTEIAVLEYDRNVREKAADAKMKVSSRKVIVMELNPPFKTYESMIVTKIGML